MATKVTKKKSTSKRISLIGTTLGSIKTGKTPSSFKPETYTPSAETQAAKTALDNVLANKPAAYESAYQDKIDSITNQYLNRDKFSYDFNADALYKQYNDNYKKQAAMGMQNTMAQAAAQTGGYGNSYAATAGNLAYQNEMSNLNNIIPELYQQAYGRYQDEGNEMLNKVNLLQAQEDSAYNRHRDGVADWQTDRSYYDNAYNNTRNFDYGQFNDNRNYNYQMRRDDVSDEQWARQYAYQKLRDSIADEQWQKEYELNKAAAAAAKKGSGSSGSSGTKKKNASTKSTKKIPKEIMNLESNDTSAEHDYVEGWLKENYGRTDVLTLEEFGTLISSNPKLRQFPGYNDYLKWKIKHPEESNTI